MRALVLTGDEPAWVLAERPDPDCGPTDVLVDVRAAGLNRGDLYMRTGKYEPTSENWRVPHDRVGYDLAGVVHAVGAEVEDFRVGQAVLAMAGGACADLVAVPHRLLLGMPDGLGWVPAAALPSALMTEYDALAVRGRLRDSEVVLVLGGSTGIGLVGIQLARALGAAIVLATTRDPDKAPLLRELGAHRVIDTSTESVAEVVLEASGGHGFDLALDHLGGEVLAQSLPSAASQARIVQIGRLAGRASTLDLDTLASRRIELIGTTFRGRRLPELEELTAEVREKVLPLVASGAVRPVIEAEFPAAGAEDAATYLRTRSTTGKLVVTGFGIA